jgi:RES domain-containing protein
LTTVYRLLRKPFAGTPFDGEGSYRYGGRWSAPGTRIAYTSEHLSLAMIEYLVHLDPSQLPIDLMLARARVPDNLPKLRLRADELPSEWQDYPAPGSLALIGHKFVRNGEAAILILPSAVAPTENNWLLNPQHPHFHEIKREDAEPFHYNPRLLRPKAGEASRPQK